MIWNYWPPWFRARVGGTWPSTYCAVDVETTGYDHGRDVITEWGHVLVVDGEVVDELSLVLDWTGHPVVPEHWLATKLEQIRTAMVLKGSGAYMTIPRMKKEGMKPDRALAFIRDFTATVKEKGIPFVAHNGVFDEKMLAGNFIGFDVAKGFTYGDDGWIDTDCIEKASQIPGNERVHPRRVDTLRSYWHRVKYTRVPGVKSSLSEHCYAKYDFAGKGFPLAEMHGALADCKCTCLLMEEFRKQVTAEPLAPPYGTAETAAARQAAPPKTRALPPVTGAPKRVRGMRRS